MTIESRLAEIRARAENATEGPWEVIPTVGNAVVADDGDGYWTDVADRIETEADAEFIAASRTDLPALLAAVEAVTKRADRWTSLDRPAGDDFHEGFNAGLKFAAGHILRDITAALEVKG